MKSTTNKSSYEEYTGTESPQPTQQKEKDNRKIDPEVWKEARVTLSELLKDFGQNKY
jgi:hypothetical protein